MKTRRLYTLKAFSRDNLIGIQSSVVLSRLGFIRVKEVCVGKVTFQAVESSFDELEEGVHYVECPECHKRMLSLETTHFFRVHHMTTEDTLRKYPGMRMISEVAKERTAVREETVKKRVGTLKALYRSAEGADLVARKAASLSLRYNTDGGELRLRQSENTRKRMSDPSTRAKLVEKIKESLGRPEIRKKISDSMRIVQNRPEAKRKRKEYEKANPDLVAASAANARRHHNGTSRLHLEFREKLPQHVKDLLITELGVGFYKLDEGNLSKKLCIEIDGCYWHGCEKCGYAGKPGISDHRKTSYLLNRGWKILRVKECEILEDLARSLSRVESFVLEEERC